MYLFYLWKQVTPDNAMQILDDILDLIADARVLVARTLLQKLEAFLDNNTDSSIGQQLKAKINAHNAKFLVMRERASKVEDTISDLDTVRWSHTALCMWYPP